MSATVIYHSADFDGIFCREIARRFLTHDPQCDTLDKSPDGIVKPCNCIQFIGWNFGQPKIPMPPRGPVYIMDLSPECLTDGRLGDWIIWIDHHKTSIEKWGTAIPGYRIDGVAACRLAWQWFSLLAATPNPEESGLPQKEDFIARKVLEPLAVRLAGEYDIWDKREPAAETFQYGLRTCEDVPWRLLLEPSERGREMTNQIIADGQAAQRYAQNVDASICKSLTWIMDWEGLKWLCVNHARFNSNLFAAKDLPETGHDALLGFRFDGTSWLVSMYHASHRKDLDLSVIAQKQGGGGHRGACGFTCKTLPFPL